MSCSVRILLIVVFLMTSLGAYAKDSFYYPELMVSPSASDRVLIEAKNEHQNKYWTHLPIQISALTTFTAGLIQLGNVDPTKDEDELSPYVGIVIGGGWLGLTYALSRGYKPYQTAYGKIKNLNTQTTKQQLIKERLAEEAIDQAASTGRKLAWLSMFTNAFANGYMLANAESKTLSIPAGTIGVLASFAPFIFEYTWENVSKEQEEYKKKIYSPISISSVLVEPGKKRLAPGLLVSFSF